MNWPLAELGDVVEILSGFAWKSAKFTDDSTGVPIIRIQNVAEKNTDEDFVYWNDEYKEKFKITKGDILLSLSGNIKLGYWNYKDALLNQRIVKIDASERIDRGFLFYFLSKAVNDIAALGKKAVISNVSVNDLKKIKIPLPPLPVQKQIAAVLEKADTLRSQCQQMEQELNALAQSVFLDMFGDYREVDKVDFLSLGECADVCSGVTKGQEFNGKPTVIAPYMRVANVQDGYLDLNEIKEIEAKVTDFDKYLLKPGDILMTEGGDHDKLGRGAVWEGQIEGCIHQNHVFRVRLSSSYLPKYFEYLLQSQYAKQYFLKCAKKTTNLASINITQLKSLPMPNLSVLEQQKFVDFISNLEEQKRLSVKSFKQLDDNFNSLMQRAFKGELKFKDVA